MKKKYLYDVDFWDGEIFGPACRSLRFALETPNPNEAIQQILNSVEARSMKGPVKSFSGPQGMVVYTD